MKKLILLLTILTSVPKLYACIDCEGTGANITFTGNVTASTLTVGWLIVGNSSGIPNAQEIINATTTLLALAQSAAVAKTNFDAIIVGTTGALGVDAYVTNVNQFNLILASFSARGLTDSTTIQGKIYFREGTYDMTGTTVPRGIRLYAIGSSVTFYLNAVDKELIYNYGEIGTPDFPFVFSGNGLAFTGGGVIRPKSNSKTYAIISGGQAISNGTANVNFVLVDDSTNAVGVIDFQQTRSVTNGNVLGGVNNFYLRNSSFCVFTVKVASFTQGATSSVGFNGFMYFLNGYANLTTLDADMTSIGFIGISGSAGRDNIIQGRLRNAPNQTGIAGVGAGIITFDATNGAVSTATIVRVDFILEGTGANVFCIDLTNSPSNITVKDSTFVGTAQANTYTAVNVRAGALKANIQNVTMLNVGTGVADSGTGTIFRYTKDSVALTQ